MNEYFLSASFVGQNFYPSKLQGRFHGMIVDLSHDHGDVKYSKSEADRTFDYGYLSLAPIEEIGYNFGEVFKRFLNNMIDLKRELDSNDLEIVVSLTLAYEAQCNYELLPNEIDLLRTLNARFTITCFEK